jgi:hypothetical protein
MSKHEDSADGPKEDRQHDYGERKEAVHERDRNRCLACLGSVDKVDKLDVDHGVPRGVGGSEQFSNLLTLCRRCHEAKHGDGLAPTVELRSSGAMTDTEFLLFKQLLTEMLPAMAREFGVRLRPKFDLDDRDCWHLPLGDVRRLDRELSSEAPQYNSLQAADYW